MLSLVIATELGNFLFSCLFNVFFFLTPPSPQDHHIVGLSPIIDQLLLLFFCRIVSTCSLNISELPNLLLHSEGQPPSGVCGILPPAKGSTYGRYRISPNGASLGQRLEAGKTH